MLLQRDVADIVDVAIQWGELLLTIAVLDVNLDLDHLGAVRQRQDTAGNDADPRRPVAVGSLVDGLHALGDDDIGVEHQGCSAMAAGPSHSASACSASSIACG